MKFKITKAKYVGLLVLVGLLAYFPIIVSKMNFTIEWRGCVNAQRGEGPGNGPGGGETGDPGGESEAGQSNDGPETGEEDDIDDYNFDMFGSEEENNAKQNTTLGEDEWGGSLTSSEGRGRGSRYETLSGWEHEKRDKETEAMFDDDPNAYSVYSSPLDKAESWGIAVGHSFSRTWEDVANWGKDLWGKITNTVGYAYDWATASRKDINTAKVEGMTWALAGKRLGRYSNNKAIQKAFERGYYGQLNKNQKGMMSHKEAVDKARGGLAAIKGELPEPNASKAYKEGYAEAMGWGDLPDLSSSKSTDLTQISEFTSADKETLMECRSGIVGSSIPASECIRVINKYNSKINQVSNVAIGRLNKYKHELDVEISNLNGELVGLIEKLRTEEDAAKRQILQQQIDFTRSKRDKAKQKRDSILWNINQVRNDNIDSHGCIIGVTVWQPDHNRCLTEREVGNYCRRKGGIYHGRGVCTCSNGLVWTRSGCR